MNLSSFAYVGSVFFAVTLTGCFGDADSDPHPLPYATSSGDGGGLDLCVRDFPGATQAQTSDYCTSMLKTSASAQCFGSGTDVYVAMFSAVGVGDFLELAGGDVLQASTAGESHVLTLESETDGTLHYTAHFATNDPELVTIAFTRGGNDGQPGGLGRVQVAAPFQISGAPTSFAYGDAIDFSVTPPPQSQFISAYIDGPCTIGEHAIGQETNVPVFSGNVALASSNMIVPSGGCNVTIHARVETAGTFDSAFAPGSVLAGLQERDFQSAMSF